MNLQKGVTERHLTAANIFGIDETPKYLSKLTRAEKKRNLATRGRYELSPQRGETADTSKASVIETICADGSLLPPTTVFNGIN